jgi:hypothetical protein
VPCYSLLNTASLSSVVLSERNLLASVISSWLGSLLLCVLKSDKINGLAKYNFSYHVSGLNDVCH